MHAGFRTLTKFADVEYFFKLPSTLRDGFKIKEVRALSIFNCASRRTHIIRFVLVRNCLVPFSKPSPSLFSTLLGSEVFSEIARAREVGACTG